MTYEIITGNNIQVLKTLPDNSIDSIVTDPPYGINFLNKSWDADTGSIETYKQCFRVLKPGGHILAFSAARTYHHLARAIEQSGFEIRDQIMWIYGSGFPKSQDIGRQIHKRQHGKLDKQRFDPQIMIKEGEYYKHPQSDKLYRQLPDINGDRLKDSYTHDKYGVIYEEVLNANNEWSGWGTNLKPAHEPIVMARKPISEKNIADNCMKHGTGALNIDATRVEGLTEKELNWTPQRQHTTAAIGIGGAQAGHVQEMFNQLGRFPANVIHDGSDEVVNMFPDKCGNAAKATRTKDSITGTGASLTRNKHAGEDNGIYDGLGSAARFFYCPKVSRKERSAGDSENNHPTVKPVELMKYLIKLVTPPGGTVLDPFNGSGSTGMAAVELGHNYIGIDLDPNYVQISLKRIAAWQEQHKPTTYQTLFNEQ